VRANIDNTEGLALSQESHRLTAAKCTTYNISLPSVNRIIKHDLRLKCMLICCKRPLPGSRLIVPVFQSALSQFSVQIKFHLFSANILHKHIDP